MIFATGDVHGDFQRFSRKHFPQQRQMGRDDYMIVTGDLGGVWTGEQADSNRPDWPEAKHFTTLFVDGMDDLVKAGLVEKSSRWRENGSLTSNLYRIKQQRRGVSAPLLLFANTPQDFRGQTLHGASLCHHAR